MRSSTPLGGSKKADSIIQILAIIVKIIRNMLYGVRMLLKKLQRVLKSSLINNCLFPSSLKQINISPLDIIAFRIVK